MLRARAPPIRYPCSVCYNVFGSQFSFFFFFNDPAPTEIYTLSLHDALPISPNRDLSQLPVATVREAINQELMRIDRKSTRLNSSHQIISYAVFCLKKKITEQTLFVIPRASPANGRDVSSRAAAIAVCRTCAS